MPRRNGRACGNPAGEREMTGLEWLRGRAFAGVRDLWG